MTNTAKVIASQSCTCCDEVLHMCDHIQSPLQCITIAMSRYRNSSHTIWEEDPQHSHMAREEAQKVSVTDAASKLFSGSSRSLKAEATMQTLVLLITSTSFHAYFRANIGTPRANTSNEIKDSTRGILLIHQHQKQMHHTKVPFPSFRALFRCLNCWFVLQRWYDTN